MPEKILCRVRAEPAIGVTQISAIETSASWSVGDVGRLCRNKAVETKSGGRQLLTTTMTKSWRMDETYSTPSQRSPPTWG
jgi:hypothetical protein